MPAFILLTALMLATALAFVLMPLLRGRQSGNSASDARHRRALLDESHKSGILSDAEYAAKRTELGKRLMSGGGGLHLVGKLKADDWNGRQGVELEIEDAADPRRNG